MGSARPSARPPSTWAEIFRCMCLQSHLQTSPPTPQKSYPKFRNPRTTFEIFQNKIWGPTLVPWGRFLCFLFIFLKISKVVLGFRNFRYEFWGVGGDVWSWLCRHVCRKISAHEMVGRAEGLACADPEARTPIGESGNFNKLLNSCLISWFKTVS